MVTAADYYPGKTSDEENIQCMKQQSRKKKLFFMLAIPFLCFDDVDGLTWWRRELLTWKILEEEQIQCMNSSKEEQRRGDNLPNTSDLRNICKGKLSLDQMKDVGVPNITRTSPHVKIPEKLNL
ncbi:hypothetical protein CDAR_227481 [Caerostris darwini]|uniref:Uncharacterized protein n=1 Tax=Caerostris darwini TaxID=1538125 RepID=A0AAV4UM25_9ARAC|nr:hypothetical protein CDAR_227481 [Caerostris darwini]